jgi:hypothetical protein
MQMAGSLLAISGAAMQLIGAPLKEQGSMGSDQRRDEEGRRSGDTSQRRDA